MPQLYLIRHGETEWSLSGQHTGRTDKELTENGRAQAECAKELLRKVSFVRVLSSPLKRAMETAQLVGLGSRVEARDELMEVNYGDFEGKTTKEIRESVPDWSLWTHACPNGESLQDAAKRVRGLLSELEGVEGSVAIFAHGHILRILACEYLGLSPENGKHLMLDTCSVSVLASEHDVPAIKMWNARTEE
jgi:probable phosphoglycerate mutase